MRPRFVTAFAAFVLLANQSLAAAEPIVVSGSATVFPVVINASKTFRAARPDVKIKIRAAGSSSGIKAAGSGIAAIGMSSRDLKSDEKAQYPDLVTTVIGRDGLALIVNAKNPVTALTKEQVRDIYVGKIVNWSDVGGSELPIQTVSLVSKHGTYEVFGNYFKLEIKQGETTANFREQGAAEYGQASAQLVESNLETLVVVAGKANAIGFAPVGIAKRFADKSGRIKLLGLDGKTPSNETVASGDYPLQRPLLLITNGQPTGTVKSFIDFVLSKDGQAIVADADFVGAH
jgi:phosphate transport system substrate-binding protein